MVIFWVNEFKNVVMFDLDFRLGIPIFQASIRTVDRVFIDTCASRSPVQRARGCSEQWTNKQRSSTYPALVMRNCLSIVPD